MMDWQEIVTQIERATGSVFKLVNTRSVSGGDINTAYCLQGAECAYFVKLNRAETIEMFAAESVGLTELALTKTVKVPKSIIYGKSGNSAYLVLEHIEFGLSTKASDRLFGQQLALLHNQPQPYFGWHRDNMIGSTPQPNTKDDNWVRFWRNQRLKHQLELAGAKGYSGQLQTLGTELCDRLDDFFTDYTPRPSLLHGDLWGGNAATDKKGMPVMYDPACYYGDKEADLAMTELFGGFSQDFYAAYRDFSPIDAGYTTRKKLYNLYHILNHLNLFGGGYLNQAENTIRNLLSEVR